MSAAKAKSGGTIRIKQIKSGIGFQQKQKATLKALGLGKINRVRELPDNPQVRGMIAKICHLVVVLDESEKGATR